MGKTGPPNENRARINIHRGGTNHHHMLQALSRAEPPLGLLHCMYAHLSSQRLLIPEEPTLLSPGYVIVTSCFCIFNTGCILFLSYLQFFQPTKLFSLPQLPNIWLGLSKLIGGAIYQIQQTNIPYCLPVIRQHTAKTVL